MRLAHAILAGACTLAGCGGQPSGGLTADAGNTTCGYVALDLDNGQVVPVADPDPADPRWREGMLLFRQLPAATALTGRPLADDLAEDDEHPQRGEAVGLVWMGVFEVTQAQWRRLGGGTPWYAAVPFIDLDGFVGDHLPAIGVSPALASATIAGWSPGGWRLDLPEAAEWEYACLAGRDAKFAWGNAYEPDPADGPASFDGLLVCDSAGDGRSRPQAVGSTAANAWGFRDMHGNAWEIVHRGLAWELRGGAWDSGVLACRASNRVAIDRDSAGWTSGLRLVLRR